MIAFLEVTATIPRLGAGSDRCGAWPCAAIGYAITNANSNSRVSEVVYLATYGEWHAPRAGETTALPGGNVAYARGPRGAR